MTGLSEWTALPELPAPPGAEGCRLCELAGHGGRVIWAEGTACAPVMVLLDNPGAREDREGRPFLCGTRQALQEAALQAGMRPEDLYVSWVVKCRPARAYDKEGARAACRPYLEQQLAAYAPRVIVPLGNVAVQALFGDPTAEVKRLRGRTLAFEGRPVVCGYHPLAVRRRPNLMPLLVADLALAARVGGLGSPHHARPT